MPAELYRTGIAFGEAGFSAMVDMVPGHVFR